MTQAPPPLARTSRTGKALLLAAALAAPLPAQADSKQTWDYLSTGLVIGLGGLAAGTTWAESDRKGGKQFLLGVGSTILATEALKALIDERRPDGSGNDSFPSGHTAAAFAAATYYAIRYGKKHREMVPVVYGAAILTGVARVEADKHYPRDVLAGAALGFGLAHLFTTPMSDGFSFTPTRRGGTFLYTMHF